MLLPGESEDYIHEGYEEELYTLMESVFENWLDDSSRIKESLRALCLRCLEASTKPKFDIKCLDEEVGDIENEEIMNCYLIGRARANQVVAGSIEIFLEKSSLSGEAINDREICRLLISLDEELCLDILGKATSTDLKSLAKGMLGY